MTIGLRGQGAVQAVASGLMTMPAPASQAASDFNVVSVVVKPFSATVTTPAGWTKIGEVVNGAVASGADVGSVRTVAFVREGVTGSAAVTVTGSNVALGVMTGYTRGGSENWYSKATTGFDATHGANFSATGELNLLGNNGDLFVASGGNNTDAGGISASTITAPGLTVGATTLRTSTASSTGDDATLLLADCAVTAGSTETAAPSYTYTDANNNSGAIIFILLRVVTASITSVTSGSGFATTDNYYQVTATGLNAFNEWEIVRTSTNYSEEAVRGGGRQPGDNSSVVLNDYEFHFSGSSTSGPETIQYRLNLYNNDLLFASLLSSSHVPLTDRAAVGGFNSSTYPTVWLKSPEMPEFNQPVVVKDFKTYSQETPVLGEHHILGRKHPIVITDILGGISGSFEILVYDNPTWKGSLSALGTLAEINGLFERGDICYFQSTFPYVSGIPDFYFIPTSITTTREQRVVDLSKAAPEPSDSPLFTITVDFREVERPSTLDMTTTTKSWQSEVSSIYGTWQLVKDGNSSWLSLLQN